MIANSEQKEVAFYYPGHIWYQSDWIKSLLLFFDGVGLLIPEYKKNDPERFSPELAAPLREQGLLHYLIADQVVDKAATQRLVKVLDELISSGVFDSLAKEGTAFHEISRSRMGFYGDTELAEKLFESLSNRGLARKSEDGVSIPLHPIIRYLILTLLAQILRPQGTTFGFELSPTTDQSKVVRALTEFLDLPMLPSAGHVVAFDLQNISVDLSAVPLDEVLAFKREQGRKYREYIRSVRRFTREISLMPPSDAIAALADRQKELNDLASDLKQVSRTSWRQPASFALGLAGAYWTYQTGDPISALLGAGAVLVGGMDSSGGEVGAYSYLFSAHNSFA